MSCEIRVGYYRSGVYEVFFRETHLRIKVNDYRHSGLLGVLLEEGVKLGSVADCANGWPSVDAEEENEKED